MALLCGVRGPTFHLPDEGVVVPAVIVIELLAAGTTHRELAGLREHLTKILVFKHP